MTSPWILTGALCCALSVTAGAFGAHGLKAHLDAENLQRWEVAARYLIYGGFGQIAIGLVALHRATQDLDPGSLGVAGASLLVGSLVFSSTVFAIALGAPRWLGAITPLGGLGMILGFVLLAWDAFRL